jgi:hypothetical protein
MNWFDSCLSIHTGTLTVSDSRVMLLIGLSPGITGDKKVGDENK